MRLEELVGKFVRIEYIDSAVDFGKFEGIDKDLNVIHLHKNNSNDNLFIPLSSVKSISESYT
ncbi:hypothetical protein P4562_17390 [Lysinibacillus xylanilyticus]|uniref:hypothetical protein n=1 Tax=Lysinibacillus xylanilyticus TaxID=582475 RepID=UPI002E21FBAE|nr:hypothetical protein [Lysinibacillus xylanilyticus]